MQAAVRENVAYDLARFDRRSKVRNAVKEEEQAKAKAAAGTKAKAKANISAFAIFSFAISICLAVLMISSVVQLSQLSAASERMEKELTQLREENQLLEIENSRRLSSEKIKEEAEGRLGMQKLDKSQITYLDMGSGNRVEIPENTKLMRDSDIIAGIVGGFRWIVEYIN